MDKRILEILKKESRAICCWGYNEKIINELYDNGVIFDKIFSSYEEIKEDE